MYCKVCGEELKPNAKFCENCGTKVKKETDAIPMLSAGFERGRLDTWYNDSSSTSVNEYGHGVQYVLHLVGRGQNGKRVYVSVYEYSDRPGDYQVQVMNTNHE